MARTVLCTLFLLVIIQNAFGASLLRQLNDGVSKINELIRDINDVRNAQNGRDWRRPPLPASYDYEPSLRRATLALSHAAKLLDQMRSFLKKSPRNVIGGPNGGLRPLSMKIAPRTLMSAEGQGTNSQGEDPAPSIAPEDAIEVIDDAQMNMENLEETIRANPARHATMKPPKFIGSSLTNRQVFNNLFYEAVAKAMQDEIKHHPRLQKEFGTDFDPINLMIHKKPR